MRILRYTLVIREIKLTDTINFYVTRSLLRVDLLVE